MGVVVDIAVVMLAFVCLLQEWVIVAVVAMMSRQSRSPKAEYSKITRSQITNPRTRGCGNDKNGAKKSLCRGFL